MPDQLNRKKIMFILPSLEFGGAERVFSFLSINLDPKVFEVKLLVIGYEKKAKFIYDLDKTIFLNKSRVLFGFPGVIKNIRKFEPDIVVSTIIHLNILMGCLSFFFRKTKFVAREASVYSGMKQYATRELPFSDFLVKFFYPRLAGIICQSIDMKEDLKTNFGIEDEKLKVINNPITQLPIKKIKKSGGNKINFITVGRLNPEKGHSRILDVLSHLQYNFEYLIIGDGPEREAIYARAKALHLEERIHYISFTNEVAAYLEKADFFLQGSFVEGFPNAVLESCTFGIPVIAFDVPGGTKEIIENGQNGFLVNSELEMADLLNDMDKLRSLINADVSAFTIDRFHPDETLKKYEAYFVDTLKN